MCTRAGPVVPSPAGYIGRCGAAPWLPSGVRLLQRWVLSTCSRHEPSALLRQGPVRISPQWKYNVGFLKQSELGGISAVVVTGTAFSLKRQMFCTQRLAVTDILCQLHHTPWKSRCDFRLLQSGLTRTDTSSFPASS